MAGRLGRKKDKTQMQLLRTVGENLDAQAVYAAALQARVNTLSTSLSSLAAIVATLSVSAPQQAELTSIQDNLSETIADFESLVTP